MRITDLLEKQRLIAPQSLIYRWGEPEEPLPVTVIRSRKSAPQPGLGLDSPPWLHTGEPDQPFDFSGHIQRLAADVVQRCDELRHIDVSRLLFGVTQARNGRVHGLQARVTPLRFPHGQLTRVWRGVTFQLQRYFLGATEYLYLVTFCLPRFLDQDFDDKLVTLFHELYHISPAFDGDLRRHAGRYSIHSHSQCQYDRHMADLARGYLASGPDLNLHSFLRLNFKQLAHRHGSVTGIAVPRPKMVRIGLAAASRNKSAGG